MVMRKNVQKSINNIIARTSNYGSLFHVSQLETSVSFAGDLTAVHVFKVYMCALKKELKNYYFIIILLGIMRISV